MSVLITHARDRRALSSARTLSEKGIDVISSDSIYPAMTFYSKYSKSYFIYPSYKKNLNDFVNFMEKKISKLKPTVLMPMDEETFVFARFRTKFEKYSKLVTKDYESLLNANNKEFVLNLAEQLDIKIPKTFNIEKISDLDKISDINYPAVIKLKEGLGSSGLSYVYNKEELINTYKRTVRDFRLEPDKYPLIQEYIPGTGYGVEMLYNHGDLRAFFTHKRIREYPISGGPSTARISVRNKKMEKIAEKLFNELKWHGVGMVEFKLDNRNNEPVLMEINPRFWGSLNQAICSGVDFPNLVYQMAVEGDVKRVFNYKTGIKTRWFLADTRTMVDYLIKSDNRYEHLKDFLNFFGKNVFYDDLSFKDPLPFFIEAIIPTIEMLKTGKLTFIPEGERHHV